MSETPETDDEAAIFERMLRIFGGLDQQGPGDDASTRRALELVPPVSNDGRVLDVGCGSGRSTLVLAEQTSARVDAVELLPALIERLDAEVARRGLDDRVRTHVADMNALPFSPGTFDLIWSEGAIYQMGFEAGLRAWRPLLVPGGHVVVTELSWRVPEPPPACRRFWAREYPGLASVQDNLQAAGRAGYDVVGHFTLPESAWWEGFYDPLSANLEALEAEGFEGDPLMAELVAANRVEIDLFRQHGDAYGYVFYALRAREA